MNIRPPGFGTAMINKTNVRFGNQDRHAQELTQFLTDLDSNLDRMDVLKPRRDSDSPNQTIYATLKHPSGRYLGVTLYFDCDDTTRLACAEVRGSADIKDPNMQHPPGRNLNLESLRYNNWDLNDPYVDYRSSLQQSPIVTPAESFWEAAIVNPVDAFAQRLKDKVVANLPN